MDSEKLQIRAILLYKFRRGRNAVQTVKSVCSVFGDDAVSERTCQRWFAKFRSGSFDLSDEPRSGRPSVVDRDALKASIEANPSVTTRELEKEHTAGHGSIIRALNDLGMVCKLNKWVPHELSESNKLNRVAKCVSLLSRHRKCPFFDRLITCDEKWVFYENVSRKTHWVEPGSAPQTVAKRDIHGKKVMLCCFWDIRGLVHMEFLKENETITSEVYCALLDRVQQKLTETRPALVNRKGVCFHQDNARPHVSARTLQKIGELNWEIIEHPPYSPDLAPSDFHLFRSLQNFLDGKKCQSSEAVQNEVENFFKSKPPEFFDRGIRKLVTRWQLVIENNGEYLLD